MDAELDALVAAVTAPEGEAVVEVPLARQTPLWARVRAAGWEVRRVDRAPVFSKETLLHALYQACALPAWFGFNWDALTDALAGLADRPAKGQLLVFADLGLLEARAPEVAATFLAVVREARTARKAPVRVVRLVQHPATERRD